MRCDQPEAHARIAVFGRPTATIHDHVAGRACQYGVKHDDTRDTPPAEVYECDVCGGRYVSAHNCTATRPTSARSGGHVMSECLNVAGILSGLALVRADLTSDEAAARDEGFDGIANAYANAGALLDGAMWGIEKTVIPCPTAPGAAS